METTQNLRNNNQHAGLQKFAMHSSTAANIYQKNKFETSSRLVSIEPFTKIKIEVPYDKSRNKINPQINGIHSQPMLPKKINDKNESEESEKPIDLTYSPETIKLEETQQNLNSSESKLDLVNSHVSQTSVCNLECCHDLKAFSRTTDHLNLNGHNLPKRRSHKRKYDCKNTTQNSTMMHLQNINANSIRRFSTIDIIQNADTNQAEVLKAAKSLFSKRTRTLFHWMYPNAPKAQLKAAVASSWETLDMQEKEFYVSQVLGRFGYPQSNLMVNPQLGGIKGIIPLSPIDLMPSNSQINEETSNAVSSLLRSERQNVNEVAWIPNPMTTVSLHTPRHTQRVNGKRRRLGRPPGSKNRKFIKEERVHVNQIREENTGDEFQDDPELNREFQQFRWTLHMNDK